MDGKSLTAVFHERLKRAGGRLLAAMACYGILALTAVFALEGILRGVVLCLIAILAFKTVLHAGDEEME